MTVNDIFKLRVRHFVNGIQLKFENFMSLRHSFEKMIWRQLESIFLFYFEFTKNNFKRYKILSIHILLVVATLMSAGMGNGTWIPWDLCPGTRIPGFGTGIGTNSLGTLGTGKNIAGTVPGQKSLGQPNPKLWDHLGLQSHGIFSFGTQVPRTKILGTGSPVPCPPLVRRLAPLCINLTVTNYCIILYSN